MEARNGNLQHRQEVSSRTQGGRDDSKGPKELEVLVERDYFVSGTTETVRKMKIVNTHMCVKVGLNVFIIYTCTGKR